MKKKLKVPIENDEHNTSSDDIGPLSHWNESDDSDIGPLSHWNE